MRVLSVSAGSSLFHELRGDRHALWARLRRDGYLYLTDHLDPELVDEFRRYYFEALAPTGLVADGGAADGIDSGSAIDRGLMRRILFDDIVPGDEYATLTTAPEIRGWFQWFLGDEVHLHKRRILRHIRPAESGIGTATQAHYDLVYLREGTDRVLSMWIPLGDCGIETGGLAYLEGSHHRVMAQERAGALRMPAASITADLPSLADDYERGGCWPTTKRATWWSTRRTSCTHRPTTSTATIAFGCRPTSATSASPIRSTGAGRSTGSTATDSSGRRSAGQRRAVPRMRGPDPRAVRLLRPPCLRAACPWSRART